MTHDAEAAGAFEPAVFVYGTLRPGEINWHHLEPYAAATEPGRLPGHRLYELEYPCAVGVRADRDTNGRSVVGDLAWLHPAREAEALAHLDWFEDYRADDPERSLYVRELATVTLASGVEARCWVYMAGLPQRGRLRPEHEIVGGEWRSSRPTEPS